jgi:hypothetical protein
MRAFIFAVAAVVAALWAIDQARAGDRIPAFDIVASDQQGQHSASAACIARSGAARNQRAQLVPAPRPGPPHRSGIQSGLFQPFNASRNT